VLRAFGETEDALVGLRTLAEQQASVAATEAAAARAARIARQRFDAGATGYLGVVDAERQLLAARRQARQIAGARLQASVALVRALGGSW